MLKKPPAERLKLLRESTNPQAQFLWAILRDSFHYCAVHLAAIADNARDVDFAMRWGFGTKQGPFELWQQAGWQQVAQWVKDDIEAGKALARRRCRHGCSTGRTGVHTAEGSWSPSRKAYVPRSELPVYRRQLFPETVLGGDALDPLSSRHRGVPQRRDPRLDARRRGADRQHHRQAAPDRPAVTEGLLKAVEIAEQQVPGAGRSGRRTTCSRPAPTSKR